MAVVERLDYDSSTGSVLGFTTLSVPGSDRDTLSSHALVYVMAGVSSRWKQVVGYHYIGGSFSGADAAKWALEIIKMSYQLGLQVVSVTSDMGAGNRSMWQYFGINAGEHSVLYNTICHP